MKRPRFPIYRISEVFSGDSVNSLNFVYVAPPGTYPVTSNLLPRVERPTLGQKQFALRFGERPGIISLWPHNN